MTNTADDELFVVRKQHLYLVMAAVIFFVLGLTVGVWISSISITPVAHVVVTVATPTQPPGMVANPSTPTVSPPTPPPEPAESPTPSPTPAPIEVSADDDPAVGPEDAPVLIVSFSDYQCPFCARFALETLPQILEAYEGKVRFVFRDFPFHTYAQKAAEAAECADDQGQFWAYHDTIFQNQSALTLDDLKKYAADLGLDTAAFDECLDLGKYEEEVQSDLQAGLGYGVGGTPTFFINGRVMVGAQPFAAFQALIEEELAQ